MRLAEGSESRYGVDFFAFVQLLFRLAHHCYPSLAYLGDRMRALLRNRLLPRARGLGNAVAESDGEAEEEEDEGEVEVLVSAAEARGGV